MIFWESLRISLKNGLHFFRQTFAQCKIENTDFQNTGNKSEFHLNKSEVHFENLKNGLSFMDFVFGLCFIFRFTWNGPYIVQYQHIPHSIKWLFVRSFCVLNRSKSFLNHWKIIIKINLKSDILRGSKSLWVIKMDF